MIFLCCKILTISQVNRNYLTKRFFMKLEPFILQLWAFSHFSTGPQRDENFSIDKNPNISTFISFLSNMLRSDDYQCKNIANR